MYWGDMSKKAVILLSAIIFLGIILRIQGLFCGLPSQTKRLSTFHFDEYITFEAIGRMNPSSFNFYPNEALYWGSFQAYLQATILKAMQVLGIFKPGSKEEMRKNLFEADKMYISGRIITGIFSLASLVLMFFCGRLLYDEKTGLWSAAFMAFSYVEVYISSIVKPDSIMLFWGIFSFYFLLKWDKSENNKHLFTAAVLNGMSFASKYTGIIFFLNFLFFSYQKFRFNGMRKTLLNISFYAFLLTAVFFMINPYFIIKPDESFHYFWEIFSKTAINGSVISGYREYFLEILPVSYGLPYLLLFAFSSFLALKEKRAELYASLFFIAFYVIKFGYPLNQSFAYSLPIAPFMALTCAWAITHKNKNLIKVFGILVLIYSFSYSLWQKSLWSKDNTISRASQYIEKNIPFESSVCVSRIEIWTPIVLRKYDTPYEKIRTFGETKTTFKDGVELMLSQSDVCDYIVISEYESKIIHSNPQLYRLKKELEDKFEKIYNSRRPENFLFTLNNSHHYLFASFMNPDFDIYMSKRIL